MAPISGIGKNVAERIALCTPNLSELEQQYVAECVRSGWVSSSGSYVSRFEQSVTKIVGASDAVATISGTSALHLALLVAGLEPGDEVIVPALTFVAPANAVRYVGAWPTFVDVEPDFFQLDPQAVADFLQQDCIHTSDGTLNRRTGRRVRAIVPIDLLGHPADLDEIHALAAAYDLLVVEDATQSLGARYKLRPVGNVSRLTCFSFNGNKLLTTGGGGMIVTNDPALAERARYLSMQAKDDAREFVHGSVGFNYRMTNIHAAIGCAQLERYDEFLRAKRRIASNYQAAVRDLPGVHFAKQAHWAESAWWLSTIRVDETKAGLTSRQIRAALEDHGIESRTLWQPLSQSPAHQGSYARDCRVAERLAKQCLTLPSSTAMTSTSQDAVIVRLRDLVMSAAALHS